MKKVVVIGGGPAGVIASAYSAINGNDTILLEKNEKLLKKLFITGKGRCNITNSCDLEAFFKNIPTHKEFMYSALYSFSNDRIIQLLNENGVPTKVERGGRVFPTSDKAGSVVNGLTNFLRKSGAKVQLNAMVTKITKNEFFSIHLANNQIIDNIDSIIIATGGMSYTSTGSTGDGYQFAKEFGHTIIDLKPALVPLEIKEKFIRDLVGLSLKNINLRVEKILGLDRKPKCVFSDLGEMMFSHYGITGPLVISASSHIHDGEYAVYIDLKPGLDEKKLDERLIRDFEKFHNKDFRNSLDELLPKRLINVVLSLSEIDPLKKANSITKEERRRLVVLLKNFKLTYTKKRPIEEAIITSGGINVKEINPSTMESKRVSGLFFCGEIIDVDGYTGGFNLQIAYSTGYLAGNSI